MRQIYLMIVLGIIGQELIAQENAQPPALNSCTYWFGNTWGGSKYQHGDQHKFMQMAVDDLVVTGDKIFTICHWDEGGSEAGVYTTSGDKIKHLIGWHSWGRRGGPAIATNEQYIFISMGHDPGDGGGKNYAGVARYTLSGEPAGWPGALGGNPACHLAVNDDHTKKPTGLAVWGDELFVSDPSADRIRVYNITDMSHQRDIPFKSPGRITVDAGSQKDLWIIDTSEHVIRRVSREGKISPIKITDCKKPMALCIDARGNLLVADGAIDRQQIRCYRTADGVHIAGADFGEPVYAGATPGVIKPGRFYRITAISTDAENNLYVGCWDCGAKIHKFTAERQEVWVLKGLEFVSCADADPEEPKNIYSPGHRYEIDYSKPSGKSWREAAITLDPLQYPNDPRLRNFWMAMQMYRLAGQKIMLGKTQMGADLYLWRFTGEIAAPAAIYFPRYKHMSGKPAEGFAVRWQGYLRPRLSGEHRFVVRADDDSRLWINGQKIIDNWPNHPLKANHGVIALEAGAPATICLEYYQGNGACYVHLLWEEPTQPPQIVPARVLSVDERGATPGLSAEYFRDRDFTNLAQKRVDERIDFPIFVGDIASPSFGIPDEHKGFPYQPSLPCLWSDTNGDGNMQEDEYALAPEGSQATMIDVAGNIWTNTGGWGAGKGAITKIPFAGIAKGGAPQWQVQAVTSTLIPADTGIQFLSKLHYDSASDRMYIGAWTKSHPFPGGGWEQMSVGPVVQCFASWSKKPTLRWETVVIPPEGLFGNAPKAWAFDGDYMFVAYTAASKDQIWVDVYHVADGKRTGRFRPTDEIGGVTGWIDMNNAVQSHRLPNGTYVIFVEEDWLAKGIYYLWRPKP